MWRKASERHHEKKTILFTILPIAFIYYIFHRDNQSTMAKNQQQQSQQAEKTISFPHKNDDIDLVEARSQGDATLLADDGHSTSPRHGTAYRRSTRRNIGVPAQTLVEEQEKEMEARRGVAQVPKTSIYSSNNKSSSSNKLSDDSPSDNHPSNDSPSDDDDISSDASNVSDNKSDTSSDEDEVQHFKISTKQYQKLMKEMCDVKGSLQSKSTKLAALERKHLKLQNSYEKDIKIEVSKVSKPLNKK